MTNTFPVDLGHIPSNSFVIVHISCTDMSISSIIYSIMGRPKRIGVGGVFISKNAFDHFFRTKYAPSCVILQQLTKHLISLFGVSVCPPSIPPTCYIAASKKLGYFWLSPFLCPKALLFAGNANINMYMYISRGAMKVCYCILYMLQSSPEKNKNCRPLPFYLSRAQYCTDLANILHMYSTTDILWFMPLKTIPMHPGKIDQKQEPQQNTHVVQQSMDFLKICNRISFRWCIYH